MGHQEVRLTCARLGLHPSRRLGQNFLADAHLAEAIVRLAAPDPAVPLLEVGPGLGALTGLLLASGCSLTAIELDARLAAWLGERYADQPRLCLVHGDAARADYGTLFGGGEFAVVANLPYAAGTPILGRLLQLPLPPARLTLMLQRDMGLRLLAAPGDDAYGGLSVRVQARYTGRFARAVPPEVFWPQPDIESAVVTLHRLPDLPPPPVLARLDAAVNAGFGQRRKMLAGRLRTLAPADAAAALAAMEALALPPTCRAEDLSPPQWLQLALAMANPSPPSP